MKMLVGGLGVAFLGLLIVGAQGSISINPASSGSGTNLGSVAVSYPHPIVAQATGSYSPLGALFMPDVAVGTNTALAPVDSRQITLSYWENTTWANTSNDTRGQQNWEYKIGNTTGCEANGQPQAYGVCASHDAANGRFQNSFNDSSGVQGSAHGLLFSLTNGTGAASGVWHHYLVSFDTSTGSYASTVDGVDSGARPVIPANLLVNLSNANGFHIMGGPVHAGTSWGYLADVMLNNSAVVCSPTVNGQDVNAIAVADCTTALAAAHQFAPSVLARFYSLGAVDPGANCLGAFGVVPLLCLRGDGAAMATNQGSGAPTALQAPSGYGIPASQVNLFASPYGPGGVPTGTPTLRWVQGSKLASVTGSGPYSMTTDVAGEPVSPGDLILIAYEEGNSSGANAGVLSCPTGFTQVGAAGGMVDPYELMNTTVCWKVATAADAGSYGDPCNGASYTSGYGLSWAGNTALRSHGWMMADYANVNPAIPVDVSGAIQNGTAVNKRTLAILTPAMTTTAASATSPEVLVSIFFDQNVTRTPYLPPATGTLRQRVANTGAPAQIMLVDEVLTANGPTQRTSTMGSIDTSTGFTIAIR